MSANKQLKQLVMGTKVASTNTIIPQVLSARHIINPNMTNVSTVARMEYYTLANNRSAKNDSNLNTVTNNSNDSSKSTHFSARHPYQQQKRPSLRQLIETKQQSLEQKVSPQAKKSSPQLKNPHSILKTMLNSTFQSKQQEILAKSQKFSLEENRVQEQTQRNFSTPKNRNGCGTLKVNSEKTIKPQLLQIQQQEKIQRIQQNFDSHFDQMNKKENNQKLDNLNLIISNIQSARSRIENKHFSIKDNNKPLPSPTFNSPIRQSNAKLVIQTIDFNSKFLEFPLDPQAVLKFYPESLTTFEKKEILDYKQIYFFGQNPQKIDASDKSSINFGYDNDRGDYIYVIKDHIAYRYEIIERIGKGSFGQTFKVFDHKRKCYSALKIIRNKKKFHSQALIEIQILKVIRENDQATSSSLIKIKDYLLFRNHVCIVFELLSINLFDFLRQNKFNGISLDLIRRFSIQILQALLFLQKQRIIHCDLKPENILLKEPNKSGVKLIDFGSSCFEDEKMYSYIQSRFYRAPEIILGLPYGLAIDIWSFGCIAVELFNGTPLFPSENEKDHFSMMMEVLNQPPLKMVEESSKRLNFFDENFQPRIYITSKGKQRKIGTKPLPSFLQNSSDRFIDFVTQCLQWEPQKRIRPEEALVHEWVLDGLPENIREQHLNQMKIQAPWLKIFQQQMPDDSGSDSSSQQASEHIPNKQQQNHQNQILKQILGLSQQKQVGDKLKHESQGIQGEQLKNKKINNTTSNYSETLKQKINPLITRRKPIN